MSQPLALLAEATATIDGKEAPTGATFDVIGPATAQPLAAAPAVSPDQLDAAVTAAHAAFTGWRTDEDARRAALLAAADVLDARTLQLSALLTAEQGKPLADAALEVMAASWWLRHFATIDLPVEVVQDDAHGFAEVHRRPLGVVAAITPWNFPLALAVWKIAPALRAGNTVVVKPSPYTPLTTLALGALLRGVFPDGVLNVVSGPDPLGAELTVHPLVRKISFTGSIATGKRVAAAAVSDLKRLTLELGGNDPAIVLPGTDVGAIALGLFGGAFMNNGQTCLAVKRVYVHESQYDDVVDALAGLARSARVGDGARVAAGGGKLDRAGYFYAPTILAGISDGVPIVDEEQFGPALPVISYGSVADAVDRANRGHFGLTASVWAADPGAAAQVAAKIDAGQVSINAHGSGVRPDLPFGGHKWSGIGVENGSWGLHGFTETQVITGPSR